MGKFSSNFKFMNRHKQADFTNEPTCEYYRSVLYDMVRAKFGSGQITPHIEVLRGSDDKGDTITELLDRGLETP